MSYTYERPDNPQSFFATYAETARQALLSVDREAFAEACALLEATYHEKRTVFVCGNGGSAAIANHMVCDHNKLVATKTALRPRVVSLCQPIEMITAIANDIGYEAVFTYQLELQAAKGDVLTIMSASGKSPNVVSALRSAKKLGLKSIAMTAFQGGPSRELADISLHVDVANYAIAEDVHLSLMQMLAHYIRIQGMEDEVLHETIF